jgi:hypothetical protein
MIDGLLLLRELLRLQMSSATRARSQSLQLHAIDLLTARHEAFDRTGMVTFPIRRNMVTISITTTTDRVGAMVAFTVLIEAIVITLSVQNLLPVVTTTRASIVFL